MLTSRSKSGNYYSQTNLNPYSSCSQVIENYDTSVLKWGILINPYIPGSQIDTVTNDNINNNIYNGLNEPSLLSCCPYHQEQTLHTSSKSMIRYIAIFISHHYASTMQQEDF